MLISRVLIIVIVNSIHLTSAMRKGVREPKGEYQIWHIKGAKCWLNEEFWFQNFSCFPKSYSATVSTLNIIATARKSLNQIFVS